MTTQPSSPLVAELLSVGTELLLGEIVDSNAAYLGRELTARGVVVQRKGTVGDNLGRIVAAMSEALSRADLLIVGGGLGPTDDDMTREAIAQLAGEAVQEDPATLQWLRDLYASHGREMPEINRKQAWLIPSAVGLPNPNGTAPGWLVTLAGGKRIAALPGPPREMQPMFLNELLPRLNLPVQAFYAVTLHTTGIGEGTVAEQLGALTQASNPSVATYARMSGTDIRIAASAATPEQARERAAEVLGTVRGQFARYIWAESVQGELVKGETVPSLAQVALSKLGERTLAVTEAGSGGALAAQLAGLEGVRGVAVSEDHATLLTLGLTPMTLKNEGVSSAQAAAELAHAASERWGATYGLAVTVDTASKQGFVTLVGEGHSYASAFKWPGNAGQLRERAAVNALTLLWRSL